MCMGEDCAVPCSLSSFWHVLVFISPSFLNSKRLCTCMKEDFFNAIFWLVRYHHFDMCRIFTSPSFLNSKRQCTCMDKDWCSSLTGPSLTPTSLLTWKRWVSGFTIFFRSPANWVCVMVILNLKLYRHLFVLLVSINIVTLCKSVCGVIHSD